MKRNLKLVGRLLLWILRKAAFVYLFLAALFLFGVIKMMIDTKGRLPDFGSVTLPAAIPRSKTVQLTTGSSFQQTLTSIHSDSAIERTFDSLMRARPGFEDTIRQLEALYPREH